MIPVRRTARPLSARRSARCFAAVLGLYLSVAWPAIGYAQTVEPRRWLPSDLAAELPASAVAALARQVENAATDRMRLSREGCEAALLAAAELRPSQGSLACATARWMLAPVTDQALEDPVAYGAQTQRLLEASPGRALVWRDAVAIEAGAVQRLLGKAAPKNTTDAHASARLWSVLTHLDRGEVDAARTLLAAALPPVCERACALRALDHLARSRVAYFATRQDAARDHAQRALAQLRDARRREPIAAVAVAAPLAILLGQLSASSDGFVALDLADTAAAQHLPPGHALVRHLGAARYAMLANEGESAKAATLMAALTEAHGEALGAYPLTRVRLGLGTAAHSYFRAEYDAGVQAALDTGSLCKTRLGDRAPCRPEALNLRALNRSSQERNDEVLAIYRQALALREALFAPGHPLITELNHNLAVTLHDIGRYDLAEAYSRRALEADRQLYGDDHEEVASDLSTLAAVLRSMGDARGAIELLEEAVGINTRRLGDEHPRTAIMHYSLGQAQLEAGNPGAALGQFETSGRIYRAIDPKHRSVPITQHGLAKAALGLERYALARRTLNAVLERYLEIYGEGHRNVASAYRDLADAERGLDQLDAAEAHLLKSLTALTRGDALEVRWRSLMSLARLDETLARPASALFFGKLSIDALQDLRATQGSLDRRLRRAFARQRSDSYRTVAGWLVDASRVIEAQRVLDLLKDEEYFEFTRRSVSTAASRVTFTTRETALRDQLNDVANAVRTGERPPEAFVQALNNVRDTLAEPGAGLRVPLEAPAGSAGAEIPVGTAHLYFSVGETTTRVLATTSSGTFVHRLPVARVDLAEQVRLAREAVLDRRSDAQPALAELYDALLRPALESPALEDGATTKLVLFLDDVLRYVPMAALSDGKAPLVSRYTVLRGVRLPDTSASPRSNALAAFATTTVSAGFPALRHAGDEVRALVADGDGPGLFSGRAWVDEGFTREAFLAALAGNYGRVHVASHFAFVPGNERDSFLVLGDDQLLTLYDWRTSGVSLAGVELLTLSGCETALSVADADGREIDGFAQTALRQGARHIVASLWPVADEATSRLMQRFYAELARGADVAAALGAAQRALANEDPYTWAGFVAWTAATGSEARDPVTTARPPRPLSPSARTGLSR